MHTVLCAADAARYCWLKALSSWQSKLGHIVLLLRRAACRPDIVHAHDWPTAPVAFGDLGARCRSVFTIHNLNYGADLIGRAMLAAAAGTTVSPTYAAEVLPILICAHLIPMRACTLHCIQDRHASERWQILCPHTRRYPIAS